MGRPGLGIIEGAVRRLQARIVKAVQHGRWNKAKALQRLLTRPASGRLPATRRVTENDGRRTPGVDEELWTTAQTKMAGATSLMARGYHPLPLRRDDFIITGHSKEMLETTVKPLVETFLHEPGLELSSEKTSITHLTEGFDFLGQNVRRYPNGKLFIKPTRKSIRSLLSRVEEIVRRHLGDTAHHLIVRLNPMIRGWANDHRHVVSKRVFARVDAEIFRMFWRWACAHPRKGRRWIKGKYFDRVGARDWWFFGKPSDEGSRLARVRLFHAASVKIVRHVQVKSDLNPCGPRWANNLDQRSQRRSPAVSSSMGIREGLSRVSWKLSCTVLRGGTTGNGGSLLDTGEKGAKTPHLFTAADGSPVLAFASLWDRWRDPASGEDVLSATIIVSGASAWMAPLHDRMPVLLMPDQFDGWLSGTVSPADLGPAAERALREWTVSDRVTRAGRNDDDPTLAEPAA